MGRKKKRKMACSTDGTAKDLPAPSIKKRQSFVKQAPWWDKQELRFAGRCELLLTFGSAGSWVVDKYTIVPSKHMLASLAKQYTVVPSKHGMKWYLHTIFVCRK
ncbi:hypothetical protein ABBQ38_002599 [Trebouxia sp. C0009 RCD-2024]